MKLNEFSWNKVANVLYLETPAGVGFSYSLNTSDYNTNNEKTAMDNYIFLQKWFQIFPEFQGNDFWISGESYAGDYVPQLALHVIEGGGFLSQNLKGLMLGNPCIDCVEREPVTNTIQVELLYYHGQISFDSLTEWRNSGCERVPPGNPKCDGIVINYMENEVGPQFDPDDVYTVRTFFPILCYF